jgi:hypothetical protein
MPCCPALLQEATPAKNFMTQHKFRRLQLFHQTRSTVTPHTHYQIMPPKKQKTSTVDADAGPSSAAAKPKAKRDKLYERCAEAKPNGEIFDFKELGGLGIAEDDNELTVLVQELVDRNQFALLQLQNGFCYRLRPKDIAHK